MLAFPRRLARRLRLLAQVEQDSQSVPATGPVRSVAIIMDGNGRWAIDRGLPVGAGHRAGAKALKRIVRAADDLGVEHLTVFSFSTENWSRPPDEVNDLMDLFAELIDAEIAELDDEDVRIAFIGRREQLNDLLLERIHAAEERTRENTGLRLWVAMNYGGRAEIVDAAARFSGGSEEEFGALMYAPELKDPELLIRTSGEERMSNFLLWQCAYSEMHFSDKLWPDFAPEDLAGALEDYAGRQRRFGGR